MANSTSTGIKNEKNVFSCFPGVSAIALVEERSMANSRIARIKQEINDFLIPPRVSTIAFVGEKNRVCHAMFSPEFLFPWLFLGLHVSQKIITNLRITRIKPEGSKKKKRFFLLSPPFLGLHSSKITWQNRETPGSNKKN